MKTWVDRATESLTTGLGTCTTSCRHRFLQSTSQCGSQCTALEHQDGRAPTDARRHPGLRPWLSTIMFPARRTTTHSRRPSARYCCLTPTWTSRLSLTLKSIALPPRPIIPDPCHHTPSSCQLPNIPSCQSGEGEKEHLLTLLNDLWRKNLTRPISPPSFTSFKPRQRRYSPHLDPSGLMTSEVLLTS
jgi:hypothetical protein